MKLIKLKARNKKSGYHSAKEYIEGIYANNKKKIDKAYDDSDADIRSIKTPKERFVNDVLTNYNRSKLNYQLGKRKKESCCCKNKAIRERSN